MADPDFPTDFPTPETKPVANAHNHTNKMGISPGDRRAANAMNLIIYVDRGDGTVERFVPDNDPSTPEGGTLTKAPLGSSCFK